MYYLKHFFIFFIFNIFSLPIIAFTLDDVKSRGYLNCGVSETRVGFTDINSENIWTKKGKLKPNKNLTISILKPIESGLNKDIFLQNLQDNIYFELDSLN